MAQTTEQTQTQTSYVGTVVDVSKDGRRLGTGRISRDDDGPPWCMQVTMLTPASQRGRVHDCCDVEVKQCNSQQVS